MRIAVTGATGFIGRYIVRQLAGSGQAVRATCRATSDRSGLDDVSSELQWVEWQLGNATATASLVTDCDAVVHSALHHPGGGFRGGEGNVVDFARTNILGTLQLIEAAISAGVSRFVFLSTCAVHERILDDRPLDEAHPLWATSHYGAHKAAIEKFVHSYGLGRGYPICALRPTGVYGVAHPIQSSKWFELVRDVVHGRGVHCERGGKEVHAADVARGVDVLLRAEPDRISGEAFNCYDLYVSEWDVAHLARQVSGTQTVIGGKQTAPRHQIVTDKLRRLGMEFGGPVQLQETVGQLVAAAGNS